MTTSDHFLSLMIFDEFHDQVLHLNHSEPGFPEISFFFIVQDGLGMEGLENLGLPDPVEPDPVDRLDRVDRVGSVPSPGRGNEKPPAERQQRSPSFASSAFGEGRGAGSKQSEAGSTSQVKHVKLGATWRFPESS